MKLFDRQTKTILLHMTRNFIVALVMLFFAFCLDVTADFFEQNHRSHYLVFMTRFAAVFLGGADLIVIAGSVVVGAYRIMKTMIVQEDK
jgi:uncharacterized membrane protein